ncbi:MAG: acetyl-CoA carboxylase carboxyl transferase subunit beta [Oscillospiraceae bacterium]|nr:acetyl-CoA carboxylase carboxyl transferase subunit beta [Oscillospiraceae bacterium]
MPNPFLERKLKLDILKSLRSPAKREPRRTVTCSGCKTELEPDVFALALNVCPSCGLHMYISAAARFTNIFDGGEYSEPFPCAAPRDVLAFPGYAEKAAEQSAKSGLSDAGLAAEGKIGGTYAIAAAIDISFMMGSMGTSAGGTVTRAAESAASRGLPLVIFCAGGGARMQEGVFSLMQMIKTSAAIRRFSGGGGFYVSVITNPTTGGITASFASLADITLAEPGALFGFAGPRVIEQTIGEKLPQGFQSGEFQLDHGFVDAIVPRAEMRGTLARLLALHAGARI